jgi:hypothetical protein
VLRILALHLVADEVHVCKQRRLAEAAHEAEHRFALARLCSQAQQPVFRIGLELQDRDLARHGLLDRGDQRGLGQGELAHDGFGVARLLLDPFARIGFAGRRARLWVSPRDFHARVAIAPPSPAATMSDKANTMNPGHNGRGKLPQ